MVFLSAAISPQHIPPEIWSQAISWLPLAHQKTMLSVSRFFHDIALPFVFSSVRLYVLGGSETFDMLETHQADFALETEHVLMRRSWEIQHRILDDPHFALLVKDMTVVIFTESQAIFEILTLTKVLDTLKNLRTFRCYGSDTNDFNQDVLTEIIQAVPSTVQHLLYSSRLSLDILDRLPNLTFLEYRPIVYHPDIDFAASLPLSEDTLNGFKFDSSIHRHLQALAIDGIWVERIPVWVYNQLTCLELISGNYDDQINLDFICHHCPLLESLSFVGEVHARICLTLPKETTFQRLHSLRLSCKWHTPGHGSTVDHILSLTSFLQSHNTLRRLYLRVFEDIMIVPSLPSFLRSIQELSHLEVFGLHTGYEDLTQEMLAYLLTYLPLGLKALNLAMSWDTNSGSHAALLMDFLSPMPNIRFLHIYRTAERLPVSVEELALELKGLTMIGLTRGIRDVDRSGPEIQITKWPRWKTKFFVESDFQDPDFAWLLKYR
ncbi:hypothetical protein Agabi119p4_2100 [Agaricus bisporus var. burnettii]|uniref:F-box domain-containing protein n=1 Tax=Agaricus bisporus var. burnettii TaxID=192524 RepID=A0A8H7F8T7_AGABI|nr:hypothetical protein Agabi119p4_2100 [Agaricus bisporus var. burnettii]